MLNALRIISILILCFFLCMFVVVGLMQSLPEGVQMAFAFGTPIALVVWWEKRREKKKHYDGGGAVSSQPYQTLSPRSQPEMKKTQSDFSVYGAEMNGSQTQLSHRAEKGEFETTHRIVRENAAELADIMERIIASKGG